MMETKTLKRFSTNSDVKMEVNSISDYLKPNMPLPQYLPYARFLKRITGSIHRGTFM